MKSFLVLSGILLLICCAPEEKKAEQNAEQKDEVTVIRKYYPNGQLKLEVPVEFKRKNGIAKNYYETGQLRQSIVYLNGLKHGHARTYYENGELYMESTYRYDHLHGKRKRYHPNGQLMSAARFFDGNPATGLQEYLLDGSPRKYYPLINVKEKIIKDKQQLELEITMSDGTRRVEFFLGDMNPNGYIDERATRLETTRGKAVVTVELSEAESTRETIRILANAYILQHDHMITSLVGGI